MQISNKKKRTLKFHHPETTNDVTILVHSAFPHHECSVENPAYRTTYVTSDPTLIKK